MHQNPEAVYGLDALEPISLLDRADMYRSRDVPKLRLKWYISIGETGHEMLNDEGVPKYETNFQKHHRN